MVSLPPPRLLNAGVGDGVVQAFLATASDSTKDTANEVRSASAINVTGCGLKSPKSRMQPLTRGPEADETKIMAVTLPHHVRVSLSGARQ